MSLPLTWEGVAGSTEHRTVGPHRAWCHLDGEWCYPPGDCTCCEEAKGKTMLWFDPSDPDAILEALAEAGVLEVEEDWWSSTDAEAHTRYVSPWKEAK